jgi:transposase-like protein
MFSLFHKQGPVLAAQASVEAAPKPAEFSADASIASMESGQQEVGALPQAETPLPQECGASDAGQMPVPTPESGPEPGAAETVHRALLSAVAPLVPCNVACAQGSESTRSPLPVDEPSGSSSEEPTTEQPEAASAEVGEGGPEAELAPDREPPTCSDDGVTVPADALTADEDALWPGAPVAPRRTARRPRKGRQLRSPEEVKRHTFTPEQRLLLLDTWRRSGLPGGDFAALVGLSKHTLYKWKQLFDQQGPAGLMDQPRGAPSGSRLPELSEA